jgi:hypothetical protein
VPTVITAEIILSNETGLLNGVYDVRARIYDSLKKDRLWYQDFKGQSIKNGAFVLNMNSNELLPIYDLNRSNLQFVLTVGNESVEIPLLTDLYSYRSLYAEFGWDIRFPSLMAIDRENHYIGIGNKVPRGQLDVGGGVKIGYEDTNVTGAIRWVDQTLKVKHPDGWVDLMYSPSSFRESQWQDEGKRIGLSHPDYMVGIGKSYAQYKLDVNGTGHIIGDIRQAKLATAQSIRINSMSLTTTSLSHPGSIYLLDGDDNNRKTMSWTHDNLAVLYGQIEGDGHELTQLGEAANALSTSELIQRRHIGAQPIVESRHIELSTIQDRHIQNDTLTIDRFVSSPPLFGSNAIHHNSISSDNILEDSLTFDILKFNNITEFVPNNFFSGDTIAPNSIYFSHIEDRSISSSNIQPGIFGNAQLKNNVLNGFHITKNAVTVLKIKPGEIRPQLFDGPLPFAIGGTGLTTVVPGRLVTMGEGMFQFNRQSQVSNLNGTSQLSIVDMDANEIDPLSKFNVVSSQGSVEAIIQDNAHDPIQIQLSNPTSEVSLRVTPEGLMMIDMSNPWLVLHPIQGGYGGLALTPTQIDQNELQNQFHSPSAITIGNSELDVPVHPGVIEYESGRTGLFQFRFWYGQHDSCETSPCGWQALMAGGTAIGNPASQGNTVVFNDSFVQTSTHSSGVVSEAIIGHSDQSVLNGSHWAVGNAQNSFIQGHWIQADSVLNSTVNSTKIRASRIQNSQVKANQADIRHLTSSRLHGHGVLAHHLTNVDVSGIQSTIHRANKSYGQLNKSFIHGVAHATVNVQQSVVFQSNNMRITGNQHWVDQTQYSHIYGAKNTAQAASDIHITGDMNIAKMTMGSQVVGHQNQLWLADHSVVYGDNNRLFGNNNRVNGSHNLVLGSNTRIYGQHDIAVNAASTELQVSGNYQVVLNAPNGVFIDTGDGMLVSATPQSGGWTMVSDRDLKTKFSDIDFHHIYQKLLNLSVSKWEYGFKPGVKHMGPMAQEFNRVFNIGEDARFITSTDADGVAFAAIKSLIATIDQLNQSRSADMYLTQHRWVTILDDIDAAVSDVALAITMKQNALKTMAENNMEQYKMLDRQLKVLSRFGAAPSIMDYAGIGLKWGGLFLLGILLGFYAWKLYHKLVNP